MAISTQVSNEEHPVSGAEYCCGGAALSWDHARVPMGSVVGICLFLPAQEQQKEAWAGQEHSVGCLHFGDLLVMLGSPTWQ